MIGRKKRQQNKEPQCKHLKDENGFPLILQNYWH